MHHTRGTGPLAADLLLRSGAPLSIAEIELDDAAPLIDLDNAATLLAQQLRPSVVATSRRSVTQAYAVRLFHENSEAAGLRWCSVLEASWLQVTLFDRAVNRLEVGSVHELTMGEDAVRTAAAQLGLV